MPTYTCRAVALDDRAMAELASAITTAHADITGADDVFAQVLFEPLDRVRCFLAGRRLDADHCFIHGHIRAGRSARDRTALIERLVIAASSALRIPSDAVWVYISELQPRAMAEYGRLLPEPGEEARWFADLPQSTLVRLKLEAKR